MLNTLDLWEYWAIRMPGYIEESGEKAVVGFPVLDERIEEAPDHFSGVDREYYYSRDDGCFHTRLYHWDGGNMFANITFDDVVLSNSEMISVLQKNKEEAKKGLNSSITAMNEEQIMKKTYYSSYSPEDIVWAFTILSGCRKSRDRIFVDKHGKIVNLKFNRVNNNRMLISFNRNDLIPARFSHNEVTRCYTEITKDKNSTRIDAKLKYPDFGFACSQIFVFVMMIISAIIINWIWIIILAFVYEIICFIIDYKDAVKGMDYLFNDLIYQVYLG